MVQRGIIQPSTHIPHAMIAATRGHIIVGFVIIAALAERPRCKGAG